MCNNIYIYILLLICTYAILYYTYNHFNIAFIILDIKYFECVY